MKTLCMDTSHRHLVLVLMEDYKIVGKVMQEAWKKQSETIFVELDALMKSVNWEVEDIQEVVITKGPGSYTGLRIAMSIAKVLCTRKKLPLYTVSTLQLYAGLENVYVLLDARSNRAYFGNYENGEKIEETIYTLDTLKEMKDKVFVGDCDLLGMEKNIPDLAEHFMILKDHYTKVENIHTLVPEYLKDESAYLVK